MKKNLIIAAKLTLICFIAVTLLTIINFATYKRIERNIKEYEESSIRLYFPDGNISEKMFFSSLPEKDKKNFYYYTITNDSQTVGYAAISEGKGYAGKIKVLVAFNPGFKIINVKMLDNKETPGIGKVAEKDSYMKKFVGTNTKHKPFPKEKKMLSKADLDSVTGATYTYKGIAMAVERVINLFNENSGNINE